MARKYIMKAPRAKRGAYKTVEVYENLNISKNSQTRYNRGKMTDRRYVEKLLEQNKTYFDKIFPKGAAEKMLKESSDSKILKNFDTFLTKYRYLNDSNWFYANNIIKTIVEKIGEDDPDVIAFKAAYNITDINYLRTFTYNEAAQRLEGTAPNGVAIWITYKENFGATSDDFTTVFEYGEV